MNKTIPVKIEPCLFKFNQLLSEIQQGTVSRFSKDMKEEDRSRLNLASTGFCNSIYKQIEKKINITENYIEKQNLIKQLSLLFELDFE